MLLAEVHGKRCAGVRGSEDFLTSAVFGHLRCVRSDDFWSRFFERCRSVEDVSLLSALREAGARDLLAQRPNVLFWRALGDDEPDLILTFCEPDRSSLVIVLEAKLNASKSGLEERDQLLRYAKGIDSHVAELGLSDSLSFRPVVYLTARSSVAELEATCKAASAVGEAWSDRFYGVQWQDILEVASKCQSDETKPDWLGEVSEFLRAVGLERFRGFRIDLAENVDGSFLADAYFERLTLSLRGYSEETHGAFYD